MTITGSAGPRAEHEAFGEDYELPNNGYYESCVSCGLADFAQRMFMLEQSAESADVLERVLYNAVLHGLGLGATNSYYQNPLSDRDKARYNSWVCCPPNLSRTVLQAGRYAYASTLRDIFVNLYVGGEVSVPLDGQVVTLKVATDYPWDGAVKFTVQAARPKPFALHLRRPGWCQKAAIKINGQPFDPGSTARGYWRIERDWREGDTLELALDLPVERMVAHPNIKDCAGKVALQRGPLVYAFEGLDNDGNPAVTLGDNPQFKIERRPDLLGGVTVIKGVTAEGKAFTAIPFYTLANRAKSAQEVWVKQNNLKLDDSWWAGRLYRTLEDVKPRPEPKKP
jgi:DUF1680 family protein